MTSREYLKSLTVVHGTLFSLQVLFAGVMFYLRRSGKFATSRLTNLTTKGPANMNEIYFYIIYFNPGSARQKSKRPCFLS